MASYINTNFASLQAQNNLSASQSKLQTSIARLSSGLRINSAADDAAGLAISDRMTSQINGLQQAGRNANDGISLAQTADGALASVSSDLQRIRQLAVQSANSTNSSSDRASLNQESTQLLSEISRVASTTQFNGLNLLDGSFTGQQFQVGANANQTINVNLNGATTTSLGSYGGTGTAGVVATSAAFSSTSTIAINGTTIGATSSSNPSGNASLGLSASSAYAKAQAINAQSSTTGVTAQATTTVTGAAAAAGALNAGDITINGISVGSVAAGSNAVSQGQNVAAAINAVSASSGVTATADNTTGILKLTATDGRDIVVATPGANGATNSGLTAGSTAGTLALSSASGFSLTATGSAQADSGLTGFTESLSSLFSVDLTSAANANKALGIVDAAISQIDSQRAVLGATSNRFQATVSNLQSTSANLSSARSRIQDTDFAAETANLSQAQILQQAGTAMLTQANSLPNSVLSLLKG